MTPSMIVNKTDSLSDRVPPKGTDIKLVTPMTPEQVQQTIEAAERFPMERVVARYIMDKGVDHATAAIHERELKRFLALCAIYGGPIGMRGDVDDLWHTFLMFTQDYRRFCTEVAGDFIHHAPNDEDVSQDEVRSAALRFDAAYAAAFGAKPREDVWPSHAVKRGSSVLCCFSTGRPAF